MANIIYPVNMGGPPDDERKRREEQMQSFWATLAAGFKYQQERQAQGVSQAIQMSNLMASVPPELRQKMAPMFDYITKNYNLPGDANIGGVITPQELLDQMGAQERVKAGKRLIERKQQRSMNPPVTAPAPQGPPQSGTANDLLRYMAQQANPMGQTSGPRPDFQYRGNIDLSTTPDVQNSDGSRSSVASRTYGFGDYTVVLPTISTVDGHTMTDNEVIAEYKRTGKHLGIYSTLAEAEDASQQVHLQQQSMVRSAFGAAAPSKAAGAARTILPGTEPSMPSGTIQAGPGAPPAIPAVPPAPPEKAPAGKVPASGLQPPPPPPAPVKSKENPDEIIPYPGTGKKAKRVTVNGLQALENGLQGIIPGAKIQVTSLMDGTHSKNSYHYYGEGADIVLIGKDGQEIVPTPEQAKQIEALGKQQGFSMLDEYRYPSAMSSGRHLHFSYKGVPTGGGPAPDEPDKGLSRAMAEVGDRPMQWILDQDPTAKLAAEEITKLLQAPEYPARQQEILDSQTIEDTAIVQSKIGFADLESLYMAENPAEARKALAMKLGTTLSEPQKAYLLQKWSEMLSGKINQAIATAQEMIFSLNKAYSETDDPRYEAIYQVMLPFFRRAFVMSGGDPTVLPESLGTPPGGVGREMQKILEEDRLYRERMRYNAQLGLDAERIQKREGLGVYRDTSGKGSGEGGGNLKTPDRLDPITGAWLDELNKDPDGARQKLAQAQGALGNAILFDAWDPEDPTSAPPQGGKDYVVLDKEGAIIQIITPKYMERGAKALGKAGYVPILGQKGMYRFSPGRWDENAKKAEDEAKLKREEKTRQEEMEKDSTGRTLDIEGASVYYSKSPGGNFREKAITGRQSPKVTEKARKRIILAASGMPVPDESVLQGFNPVTGVIGNILEKQGAYNEYLEEKKNFDFYISSFKSTLPGDQWKTQLRKSLEGMGITPGSNPEVYAYAGLKEEIPGRQAQPKGIEVVNQAADKILKGQEEWSKLHPFSSKEEAVRFALKAADSFWGKSPETLKKVRAEIIRRGREGAFDSFVR